jgi:hypothetical protein
MTLTVIGDDFDPVVLPDTHTSTEKERIEKKNYVVQRRVDLRVCGSEIDTNSTVKHVVCHF